MSEKVKHTVDGKKFIIEMVTNRFTYDLVSHLSSSYPFSQISLYNIIEFNLEQVRMIDSSSIGYLFELNDKLKSDSTDRELIISVGKNHELKDLLHRFQVDLLLNIQ